MKHSRLILAMAALALMVSLAGCAKVWTVDFARVDDVSDWQDDGEGTKELVAGVGLNVDGGTIGSPVAFDSDFEASLKFRLEASAGNRVDLFFHFCDTITWNPDNYFNICFVSIGEDGKEGFQIMDNKKSIGTVVASGINLTLPYFHRDGYNTLLVKKTGSYVEMYMNGELIYEFVFIYCQGSQYYIRFGGNTQNAAVFTMKSVKVSYKGEII